MNQQTEALRLADALDADATNGDMGRKPDPKCHKRQAAAELRRLHQALAKQPAQPQQEPVALEEYDAGLLNDYGGGNVEWWQDYIRAELGRAYEHYQSQMATPPAAQRQWTGLTDEQQIAEALRRHGLTLIKTASGYDVLKLGQIDAHGIKENT